MLKHPGKLGFHSSIYLQIVQEKKIRFNLAKSVFFSRFQIFEKKNFTTQIILYFCIFALKYIYLLGTNQKLTKVSPAQANLHRQRYLLHFLQHSCLPDLKEYVKGLPKIAMSPSMDVAYTQIQPKQHDGNSVDYAQLVINIVNEKKYLSPVNAGYWKTRIHLLIG